MIRLSSVSEVDRTKASGDVCLHLVLEFCDMCSLTIECILLLQNAFSYYRMCLHRVLEVCDMCRDTNCKANSGGCNRPCRIYTYTCTHLYIYEYIDMYICMCTYEHTYELCIYAYMYRCIYVYTYASIHPYIHSFNHSYMHTYIMQTAEQIATTSRDYHGLSCQLLAFHRSGLHALG